MKHVTAWLMSLCCLDASSYFLQETKSSLVCFICFILALAADSSNDETALIPAFVTSSDGKTSWLFYQTWFVPLLFKRHQFTFCRTQKSQKGVGLGAELTWPCVCDWLGGSKDCNIKLWWKRTGDCFSILLLSTPFFFLSHHTKQICASWSICIFFELSSSPAWFHSSFASYRLSSSHAAHPGVTRWATQFSRRLTRLVHQQSFHGTKPCAFASIG